MCNNVLMCINSNINNVMCINVILMWMILLLLILLKW